MAITQLEVKSFRNITHSLINPEIGLNFIFGDNGSGKTSLLEAIFCLGRGKSFRTHKTSKLIQAGKDAFTVVGKIAQHGRNDTVGMERSYQGSQIRISGKAIKTTAELTELLPIAILEPGLHRLIEEGPEYRRKFMDWGVFHVEPGFGNTWKNYRRALDQRNAALRDRWTKKAIMQWDRELAQAAMELHQARQSYLDTLFSTIQDIDFIGEALPGIDFSYQCGWRAENDYGDYLAAQYESDRERGFTQFGPHRADLKIRINGVEAKEVLSRGQQKLLVASLILAQCEQLSHQETSTVVLVDDLPAELDPERRQALLTALVNTRAQVFITGTEMSLFSGEHIAASGVFHVEQGQFEREQ
ncbi:DNA replication/repair protein RecF [Kaarinaea lacus]